MRAGSLDQRVTIQRQSNSRDEYGGETINWVDVATVWASVAPLTGKEFLAAQQLQGETILRVVIRWRSGITTSKVRLLHHEVDQGGSPTTLTPLDVIALLPSTDRRRWIQFMCRSGVNNG